MNAWLRKALSSAPLHMAIVGIALIWSMPSVGLLISSFRPRNDVLSSGWWTVFQHPFDFTQFQLNNYIHVLTTEGMGRAFLNSLTISIPSTVIPIAVAAFAGYASGGPSSTSGSFSQKYNILLLSGLSSSYG